jgi:hypothetical protein
MLKEINKMKKVEEIILEDIVELLDKRYTLIYVDRDSNLDNSLEKVQEAIQQQDYQPLDDIYEDWQMYDNEWNSIDYIFKNDLKDSIVREFEIEEEDAESLIEKYNDELKDEIYNRDDSDFLGDLIRNTSDPVMFYDLGEEICEGCLSDEKEGKEILKNIKKALKIKLSETKWDNQLEIMISQGDNGRLVIYFTADIKQMLDLKDKNTVTFSNPHVAIIDTWNGAGDNCQLEGHSFTIPFTLENFFMDKAVKYSYTYQVCGMYSNWCEDTKVKFGKKSKIGKKTEINISYQEEMIRENCYKKTFKSGKCTRGDMDMRRHRNTYYLNEFPCGTHCSDCGNFWVD